MIDNLEKNEIIFSNGVMRECFGNGTTEINNSQNTSEKALIYYIDKDDYLEKEMQAYWRGKVMEFSNEISIIISHDEYIDGEVSQSEIFMKEAYAKEQMGFVMEALMQIYSSNLLNVHVLQGILVMISCVPYEAVEPKGQVMAMGLLSNKELIIRDCAIQCFERWNSKKGLTALKSLNCQPKWLQKYVDKVIMYIERDGLE